MKNAIETNGSLCSGNLEDIVHTHQNIFTSTTDAQFTLSQDHQLNLVHHKNTKEKEIDSFLIQPMAISIKPKSRYKIPKKCLKSSREQSISG